MPKKEHIETFEESVQRPRRTCTEIAPELARLEEKKRGNKRRLFHLQSMLKRASIPQVPKLMKHVRHKNYFFGAFFF